MKFLALIAGLLAWWLWSGHWPVEEKIVFTLAMTLPFICWGLDKLEKP